MQFLKEKRTWRGSYFALKYCKSELKQVVYTWFDKYAENNTLKNQKSEISNFKNDTCVH